MKWTRHLCQVALKIFVMAASRPSCASEVTSFTPHRPRRAKLRRNSTQNGSASLSHSHSKHFAASVGVDANRDDHRDRDDVMVTPRFDVGRIEPHVRPLALDRPGQEGLHPSVDLAAETRDLALADAIHAERLNQVSTKRVEMPWM